MLRFSSVAAVVILGVPPWIEVDAIAHPTQRAFASLILLVAAAAGVWAAVRLQPLGARITTLAYGASTLGLGLFATNRPIEHLLAYVVALIGINVLLYHSRAFGPALASASRDDATARRTRAVILRSLMISGGALVLTYGGSLLLLPAFSLEFGVRDPITALLLAAALILSLLFLALQPGGLPTRRLGVR
ncbi:MAG TPA: hypothetical protein VJ400_07220 [Thermoplasmata archaeon]|nr:hypothetical protein [Thermoplasmata archaeon]